MHEFYRSQMFVSSYLEGRLDNKILCAYIDCDVFVHNQAVIMEALSFDQDYILGSILFLLSMNFITYKNKNQN